MGVNEVALGLTLGIAAFTDWREHKIYNKLLFPAFFIALLLHSYKWGVYGLTSSLLGATTGFLLLLLPYLMGGMGGGDVKLLTVIGAFGGPYFAFTSFLYGALIGGLISAFLLARRKALVNTLMHLLLFFPVLQKSHSLGVSMCNPREEKFPYGIAIALGTMITMFLPLGGGRP